MEILAGKQRGMLTLDPDDVALAEQLAAGLQAGPQAAAGALKAIVAMARRRAADGAFDSLRALADEADAAVERVRAQAGLPDGRLASLAMLAHQTLAVLALAGGSGGERDSGYYRAALAHAERLDAMTEGVLRLVELVNLIGVPGSPGGGKQETGDAGKRAGQPDPPQA